MFTDEINKLHETIKAERVARNLELFQKLTQPETCLDVDL
jgi:hypothetical protein